MAEAQGEAGTIPLVEPSHRGWVMKSGSFKSAGQDDPFTRQMATHPEPVNGANVAEVLGREAVQSVEEAERLRQGLILKGLNGYGYTSRGKSDVYDLARIMYAEALGTPEDYEGIGWVTVNRTGRYRPTISEAIHQPGQYQSVREGNPEGVDSIHWTRFATPHLLDETEAKARQRAFEVAEAILNGRQPDITGGATHFQTPDSGSLWFPRAVRQNRLEPLPYRSKSTDPGRHLFYRETGPLKRD